jgi:hypothetical protein
MVASPRYVPVFPTRTGELGAMGRLERPRKELVTPLFVLVSPTRDRGTSAKHRVRMAVEQIAQKWGRSRAYLDTSSLSSAHVVGVDDAVRYVLEASGVLGLDLVPVATPEGNPTTSLRAVLDVVGGGEHDVCLRVPATEWHRLENTTALLTAASVTPARVDLVLDLEGNARPGRRYFELAAILRSLPAMNAWRSLAVVGTGYPPPRQRLGRGITEARRFELLEYARLRESLAGFRIPDFGDYAVTHPWAYTAPPYVHEVTATLRYTTEDSWLIARGGLYSTEGGGLGSAAVPPIAKELSQHPKFGFSQHCRMEEWVAEVAYVGSGGGRPVDWHELATLHHVLTVCEQLEHLAGPPRRRAAVVPRSAARPDVTTS